MSHPSIYTFPYPCQCAEKYQFTTLRKLVIPAPRLRGESSNRADFFFSGSRIRVRDDNLKVMEIVSH